MRTFAAFLKPVRERLHAPIQKIFRSMPQVYGLCRTVGQCWASGRFESTRQEVDRPHPARSRAWYLRLRWRVLDEAELAPPGGTFAGLS
jgi:hypothetical protein